MLMKRYEVVELFRGAENVPVYIGWLSVGKTLVGGSRGYGERKRMRKKKKKRSHRDMQQRGRERSGRKRRGKRSGDTEHARGVSGSNDFVPRSFLCAKSYTVHPAPTADLLYQQAQPPSLRRTTLKLRIN